MKDPWLSPGRRHPFLWDCIRKDIRLKICQIKHAELPPVNKGAAESSTHWQCPCSCLFSDLGSLYSSCWSDWGHFWRLHGLILNPEQAFEVIEPSATEHTKNTCVRPNIWHFCVWMLYKSSSQLWSTLKSAIQMHLYLLLIVAGGGGVEGVVLNRDKQESSWSMTCAHNIVVRAGGRELRKAEVC